MCLDREQVLRLLLAQRTMLVGYITSIVRDPHMAEDVFQNVAVLVLKKGPELRQAGAFPAWVREVARREALAELRRHRHTRQPLDDSVLDLLEDHWSAHDNRPLVQATEALRECTKKLGPRARRLIEMRYVQNLRGKDLAEQLGQPPNTVYVAMSRIYRALSVCIKARLAGQGVSYE
jgi:RNA polymerase sigma-70 factor (ECF subfamily)